MSELVINKKMMKEKRNKITPYAIVCGLVLLVYSFLTLFPILWGVMNSFKHYDQFAEATNAFPDFSYFKTPSSGYKDSKGNYVYSIFSNYLAFMQNVRYEDRTTYYTGIFTQTLIRNNYRIEGPFAILIFLWNTVLTCFAGTIIPIMLCCIMAYVCAKYKYKFSGFIYGIVIFSMSCPVVGRTAAMLAFQKTVGIYDNMWGFMIFNANFTSMFFMVFFAFYQGLPDSYLEAAEIDGASQFRILTTIAIPLAGTMIMASFVVLVITCWNDYNTPLLYLPTHPTIAYGVYWNVVKGSNNISGKPTIVLATFMYLIVPAFILFILLRNQLMGNLSVGGIKG